MLNLGAVFAGQTSLSPGASLQMTGASVTTSKAFAVWWTLAVSALDQGGNVLATASVSGEGSKSGIAYTLGPLTEAGAQVSVRGVLSAWTDASRTTPFPGSPLTAKTGVVAVVASTSTSTGGSSGSTSSSGGTTSHVSPAGADLGFGAITNVQATTSSITATVQLANDGAYTNAAGSVAVALQVHNASGTQTLTTTTTVPQMAPGASVTPTLTWTGLSSSWAGQAVSLTFVLANGASAAWSLTIPGTSQTTTTPTGPSAICQSLSAQYDSLSSQMQSISAQIVAQEDADGNNPTTILADPVIQSLSAQFQTLAAQLANVQTQMAANGCA